MIRIGLATLLVATATTSALVTSHREGEVDARAADEAIGGVILTAMSQGDATYPVVEQERDAYLLPIRNNGVGPAVLTSVGWPGRDLQEVDKLLLPGETRVVRLPIGHCPDRRVPGDFNKVEAVVSTHGRERRLELTLVEPEQASYLVNELCGLQPVASSYAAGVVAAEVRPGHVRLDISLAFSGKRPVELLEVTAADGVRATVAQQLPITLAPVDSNDFRDLPEVLTVTLELEDCDAVERRAREAPTTDVPPRYDTVQLSARHPGDEAETLFLTMVVASANTFAKDCDVPTLVEEAG